ncbi:MAG: peptidase S24 [Candidatus Azobacteroides sp.]|nr:peptidase S24 [Candidatus Azobacteroides sp.]
MKTTSEVLRCVLEHEKLNANQLASRMGLSRTQPLYDLLNGKIKRLSENYADKIIKAFPDFSRVWLLTGEGEMLRSAAQKEAIMLESANIAMVPLVSQYAYAGYMGGFADTEYLETLPTIPVVADHELKGTYLSFEVKGDSMDDGSVESLCEGDILVCRQVKQELWQDKLHINKWDFVVVHRTEGVFIKRIIDHNTEKCEITIHSLNDMYSDKTYSLNDIAQLFNVVQVIRNRKRC